MRRISSQILPIGVFLFLFGTGQSVSAANYFNWDLESDMTSIGEVYSYNGNTVKSNDTAHSGSWAMKSVVTGDYGTEGQELGADVPWIYMPFNIVGGPPLYYQWWMKMMPGFNWGSSTAKTQASRVLDEKGIYPDVYTGYVASDGFSISGCEVLGPHHPAKGGGCDPLNAKTVAHIPFNMRAMDDGEWHEYVVRVKPNSATTTRDAEFEAWVDGVSKGAQTGFRLHDQSGSQFTEAQGGWMVSQNFQLGSSSSSGGTIYLDDFSVDGEYNSLIGSMNTIPINPVAPLVSSATPLLNSMTRFGRNLSPGVRGEDVKTLQRFFIQKRLLRPGNDTGYFGTFTGYALREFQYKEDIVCHGTATTTGWGNFGPKTRERLNELIRTNSRVGIPLEKIYGIPAQNHVPSH